MPRQDEANYVAWVPRESNKTADFLANIALCDKEDFVWTNRLADAHTNLIVMSDGGFRKRTGALAWLIFEASTLEVVHIEYNFLSVAQSSF